MKILVEREIPNGSKRIGWGWGTEPTGEDAWSIKLPTRPDVIGTMKDCAEEAEHARRVCGDAFWSGRWFVDDWPIVQIWDLILVYKDEWEVYAHGRRCVFDHEPTYEELENIDAPSIGNRVINSRASHYGWIETNPSSVAHGRSQRVPWRTSSHQHEGGQKYSLSTHKAPLRRGLFVCQSTKPPYKFFIAYLPQKLQHFKDFFTNC